MLNQTIWLEIIMALSLIIFSTDAFAVTCNEKSPNLITEGEKYFDLTDTKHLTKKQKSEVKRIFSSLPKRLEGKGIIISCEGPENELTEYITKESLSAEFQVRKDGEILIELEVFNVTHKSSHHETLKFLGKEDDYILKNITDNSIELVYKRRIRRTKRATPLYETIVRLDTYHGKLTIDILNFYNGHFSDSSFRKLYP